MTTPDQRNSPVVITGAEQARKGQSHRVLFDSSKVPWINDEIDHAVEFSTIHSILHVPDQRRMIVSLEKIQNRGQEIGVESIAHAYFLVLSGNINISGQKSVSYNPLSFFGPVNPQKVSGNGEVLKVSFTGDKFGFENQGFVGKRRIRFSDLKPTEPGEELKKVWFTGNRAIFGPDTPGWNKFFSMGLAWSSEFFTHQAPDLFENRTMQLFIPLPHALQPKPLVEVLWQTLGPYKTSAVVSKNQYGSFEIGGIPDPNHPIFFQHKNISPGSLIFLIHVNDPNGQYQKESSKWHADLRTFNWEKGSFPD